MSTSSLNRGAFCRRARRGLSVVHMVRPLCLGLVLGLGWSWTALAQSDDCNGNGIPDWTEWGTNYAFWAPTSSDGSGDLADPASWCPAPFDSNDLLIFVSSAEVGATAALTFGQSWMAGGMSFSDAGSWKLESTNGAGFTLSDQGALSIGGSLEIRCPANVLGVVAVDAAPQATLRITDTTLDATSIRVGVSGGGEMWIVGSSVQAGSVQVGGFDDLPSTHGTLTIASGGLLVAQSGVVVQDELLVLGQVDCLVRGSASAGAVAPLVRGSGTIKQLDGSRLVLMPQPGVGQDGVNDDVLEVTTLTMVAQDGSGESGALKILLHDSFGTVHAPSIAAGSATLGGTLLVNVALPSVSAVPPSPIVTSATPIDGAFDVIQSAGLPPGVVPRLVISKDLRTLKLTTQQVPPPPSMQGGTQTPLLRVATDNAMADFDGDGIQDVAVAMAMGADGKSALRFFKTTSAVTQQLAGQIDFPGEVRQLCIVRLSETSLPSIAATLAGDAIIVAQNQGDWMFSLQAVPLAEGDDPRGIASGRFSDASTVPQSDLAVACAGKVRLLALSADGSFQATGTIAIEGGESVAAGNLDGTGLDDLAVTEAAGNGVWTATSIGSTSPAVSRWPLPRQPMGLALASLRSSADRNSVICTMASPPDVVEPGPANIAILAPGSGSLLRAPMLLAVGVNASDVDAADLDDDGLADIGLVTTVDGVERVAFLMNVTEVEGGSSPLTLIDGGTLAGVARPRLIEMADSNGDGTAEIATISAGQSGGGSLGPDYDSGLGSMGGGGCVAGDIDCDGDVDGADLAGLLGSWGSCSGCSADFDGDGNVSGSDLATLLGNWG